MTRGRILALTLVLAVAFGLRLLVLPMAWGRVPLGDPYNYMVIAKNMLAGRGMVIDDPWLVPNLRAFYPPLYPSLLALMGLVAPLNALTLLSLNFAIDVAAAAAIAWLGALCGNRRAGLVAAAAWLLWPNNILAGTFAYKEGLVTLLVVLAAALMLRSGRTRGLAAPGLLGLCTALLALTQPSLSLLPAFFALVLLKEFPSFRDWLAKMSAAAGACMLCMLPWWVRNYLVFDAFVPLTTATGMTWWIGIQPSGRWIPAPDRLLAPELEMSRLAAAEAWAWVSAHPVEYIADCLRRSVRLLLVDVGFGVDLHQMKPLQPVPMGALVGLTIAAHMVLALGTIAAAVVRRNLIATRLLLAGLLYFFLFQIWFVGAARLRYHLAAIALIIVAAWIVEHLPQRAPRQ